MLRLAFVYARVRVCVHVRICPGEFVCVHVCVCARLMYGCALVGAECRHGVDAG